MPGRNISRTRTTTRRKPASSTAQSKAKSTSEPEQPPTDSGSKIVPMSAANSSDTGSSNEMPKSLDLMPAPTHTVFERPTEVSHLSFSETVMEMGESRPVTASHLHISETLMASGSRPIFASHLEFSETSAISRPIASNDDTDEPDSLMGYLD